MGLFRRLFRRGRAKDKVSANPTPHPKFTRPADKISANPTPHPKEIRPADKISANPTPHPKEIRPQDTKKLIVEDETDLKSTDPQPDIP